MEMHTITLNTNELQYIIAVLAEQPYKTVAPLLDNVKKQLDEAQK